MQSNLNNVVLVGPMGSGKTTVGRMLSERLGVNFYDADHEIIDKTGVSIDQCYAAKITLFWLLEVAQ